MKRFVDELALAMMGSALPPPPPAVKAFRNWPEISAVLHDLFERAPREALPDPEAMLAHMALEQIESDVFPEPIRMEVQKRAEAVLAECVRHKGAEIMAALAEPKRLVQSIDEFVARFNEGKDTSFSSPLPEERDLKHDATERVRKLLENCRKLDRALSDIPRNLRNVEKT